MRRRKTLRERMETRIARKRREDVFLPREFRDLGGEDQVLRALRTLGREKRLVRLGYGIYGRAVVSRLSGAPILYSQNGFLGAARQASLSLACHGNLPKPNATTTKDVRRRFRSIRLCR
jgi:hypothetical protein